jgi:ribonuclease HI
MENLKIEIYTDGSCVGNPGPGGYGVIILNDKNEIKLSGGEKSTTNNRMEMMAMIKALEWIKENGLIENEIIIYSDSNLLIQTLNQGWKRKANLDLWEKLDKLRAWLNINWVWVKAHATNKYNNQADELALSEAKKQKSLL